VRIYQIGSPETTLVAVLLPLDNRTVGLFPPGSPEESAVPSRLTEDTLDRWPNPCAISLLDPSGTLDLDADGFSEVSLRRFCSCGGTGCSGVLFLELVPERPRILDPSLLVTSVRLGRIVVEGTDSSGDSGRPNLRVLPDYLEDCRFIAAIGVRGASECPSCCRFPVLLRPTQDGGYEPFYDPQRQIRLLGRAENDLGYVAAGEPGESLRSYEQAQIARAAAFFFLTGAGSETGKTVLEGLGPRGRGYQVEDLMNRLSRFFLP
jgi:hypothetical protein